MSTMTGNPTYNLTAMSKDEILQNHHSVMLTLGISLPEEDIDIPKLYWIPKLHKNPYKQRYIAGSAKCSTKPLSQILTMHMQAIAGVLQESIREELKQTIRDEIPGNVTPIVNGVVQGLKDQISKLQSDNQKLTIENQELKGRVAKLESLADSAEQYSRRHSLRVSGIPESLF